MSYGSARQATRYREMEIMSAAPGQLVVILYDHLLVTLRRARMAIEAGDVEARGELLEKARAVVTELLVTLDHDRGGDIARNLSGLYSFILSELVQAGVRPSAERLDRVTVMVGELRDAFAQIAATPMPQAAAQTA